MKKLLARTAVAIVAVCLANSAAFAIEELILPEPEAVFTEESVVADELVLVGDEFVAPAAVVTRCNSARVTYRYHRFRSRNKFERCDLKNAIAIVKNPCGAGYLEVPICVPDCCTAVCSVSCRNGLFGRKVYEYDWDCGFRMQVIVCKDGDMIVHYYGVR